MINKTKLIQYKYRIIVFLMISTYTIVLSIFTLAKHRSFTTYAWDLGIFNQAFWTTVNLNKIFYYTTELHLVESGSFFGIHFSPILFTLVPLYYLYQSAETLLILQSLIIGLSAYPIFLIGKHYFNEKIGTIFSSLYLLNPVLHGINAYDFHVQAFLPLILGFLVYFTIKKRWTAVIITCILALTVQEQVVYLIFVYNLYMILQFSLENKEKSETKRKMISVFLIIMCITILWQVLSTSVIHYFNPNIPAHLKASQHFAVLGVEEPLQIPIQVLRNPIKTLNAISYDLFSKIAYLLSLFTPYLFLSFQNPLLLIPTIPWFTLAILSNYPPYYRIGFQYTAYNISFIFISAIQGFKTLQSKNEDTQKTLKLQGIYVFTILCIVSTLFLSPLSPLTGTLNLSPAYQKPITDPRNQIITQFIDTIPPQASVLTQDNIFPHVSSRLNAFVMIPATFQDMQTWKKAYDYMMNLKTEYILIDLERDPHGTASLAFKTIQENNYGLVSFFDNIYLYKINYTQEPIYYIRIDQTYNWKDLLTENAKTTTDETARYQKIITYHNKSLKSTTIWYGPYEILPKGQYTATFYLKTSNNQDPNPILIDVYTNKTTIASAIITEDNLQTDTWTPINLEFKLDKIVTDLEFRGIRLGKETHIMLDYIHLKQDT